MAAGVRPREHVMGVARGETLTLIALALVGVLGTALLLVATPEGIGISNSDAVNYARAAQSLVDGQGFRQYDGGAFVRWPPLFPTLIALPMWLGLDQLESMRLINATGLGLTVLAAGLVYFRMLRSRTLALLGALSVLLAWPLFIAAYFGLAETVFNLLVALFFLALWPYLDQPAPRSLLILSLIAALLCLQRYLGVAFVAAGGLAILFLARREDWKARLRDAVVFGALAMAPLGLWFLRNLALVGSLAGGGWSNRQSLMHLAPDVIASWLWPEAGARLTGDPTLGAALTVGFAVLLAVGAGAAASWLDSGRVTWAGFKRTPAAPLVLSFPVIILLFALLAGTLQVTVNDRILSPYYVPMLGLILVLIDALVAYLQRRRPVLALVPLALVALWLARPAARVARELDVLRRDYTALDFNHPAWRSDSLIAWVNANPLTGMVYSNAPFSVALHTDIAVQIAPMETEEWPAVTASDPTYLIWYRDVDAIGCYHAESTRLCFDTDYDVTDLEATFDIEPVVEMEQGGVYRLRPLDSAARSGSGILG